MRLALVVAVLLLVPATAEAYVKLAPIRLEDRPTILGSEVLIGTRAPTGATLTGYSLDGVVRPIAFPAPTGERVFSVGASSKLMVVITGTGQSEEESEPPATTPEYAGFVGPPAGPLRPLKPFIGEVAVSGSTILSIERHGVYARREGARPRRFLKTRKYNDASDLRAAGRFAAYVSWAEDAPEIVVHAFPSGREVYRVPYEQDYALTSSGRVVYLDLRAGGNETDNWPGWIMTASPAHPRPRVVRKLRLHTAFLAAGGNRIVVAERAGKLGRLVAFDFRGRHRRVISAPMNDVGELVYDGRTLTFGAGLCTYAGPLPEQAPALPQDGCFDVAPELDGDAKRNGEAVDVAVTCVAPPGATCRATLRLVGEDGALVLEQEVAAPPGRSVQRLPVPPGTAPFAVELHRDGHARGGTRIFEG